MAQESGEPGDRCPQVQDTYPTTLWPYSFLGLKHRLRGLFLQQGPQGREAGPVIHSGGEEAVVPALPSQVLSQLRQWGPWRKAVRECEVEHHRSAFQVQASSKTASAGPYAWYTWRTERKGRDTTLR